MFLIELQAETNCREKVIKNITYAFDVTCVVSVYECDTVWHVNIFIVHVVSSDSYTSSFFSEFAIKKMGV